MTEAEIMKALEWCELFENNIVFNGNGDEKCVQALQMMVVIRHALKDYNRKNAKIEKLNFENLQMVASIKGLRAEAINEFAEGVRKYLLFTKCVNDEDINDIWRYLDIIAKEMGVEL